MTDTKDIIKMREAIFNSLAKIPCGVWKKINPQLPSYDLFIELMKGIIDANEDIRQGFSITFNNDYTAFRKDVYTTHPK